MAGRSPRRGLVWALAASLTLHVFTLSLQPLRMGAPTPEPAVPLPQQLAVQLLPPAAAVQGSPALLPPPREAAAGRVPPPDAGPSPPPAPALGTRAGSVDAAPPAPNAGSAADAPLARPGDSAAPAPSAAAAEAGGTTGPSAGEASPPRGSIRFPRSGRLDYAVSIGDPPTQIGRAIYTWEASDETYRLSLSAETTGLVGLVRRVRVVQTSEGRITPEGLQPDAFAMDRGPKARNEFARFDWPAKQVTFGYPDALQTAALYAGAQDTLSLILQFAFVPIEQGRRDVLLTTGRKVYVQAYERVAEEVIETPAGGWRTWHLRRVRAQPGDEGYDMWLSTDRPYLPVRIRWTDRNGRTTNATLDTVRLAQD